MITTQTELIKQKRDKFRLSCRKEDIEAKFKQKRGGSTISELKLQIMEMDSIRLKTKEIQQQYNMVLTSLEGHEVATVVIRPQEILNLLYLLTQIMPYNQWKLSYESDLRSEVQILFGSLIFFDQFPDELLVHVYNSFNYPIFPQINKIFEILIWVNTKFYKEKSILDFIEYMFIKFNHLNFEFYDLIRSNTYFGFRSLDKLWLMLDNESLPESSYQQLLRFLFILVKYRLENDIELVPTLINLGILGQIEKLLLKNYNAEIIIQILLSLSKDRNTINMIYQTSIPMTLIGQINELNYNHYVNSISLLFDRERFDTLYGYQLINHLIEVLQLGTGKLIKIINIIIQFNMNVPEDMVRRLQILFKEIIIRGCSIDLNQQQNQILNYVLNY